MNVNEFSNVNLITFTIKLFCICYLKRFKVSLVNSDNTNLPEITALSANRASSFRTLMVIMEAY